MRLPPAFFIPDPSRTETIPANDHKTVFLFTVPVGCVAWIEKLANDVYDNTYWELYIDKMLWKNERIDYVLGFINSPLDVLIGPIFKKIEFICYNDNDEDVEVTCLVDGKYYKIPEGTEIARP